MDFMFFYMRFASVCLCVCWGRVTAHIFFPIISIQEAGTQFKRQRFDKIITLEHTSSRAIAIVVFFFLLGACSVILG